MSFKTKEKTALVFGSSGMTGQELTNLLLIDERYEKIKIFVRKPSGRSHPKLVEVIDELSDPERISGEITGDDLFCCLGTTIKKAGSEKAFAWVDLELPSGIAGIAANNNVNKFLIISSIGANHLSANFYLRTKGLMERRILEYRFNQVNILRPSMLLGNREERRIAEEAAKMVMRLISFIFIGPLKKYKPIKATTVARAMIRLANSVNTMTLVDSDKIQEIGK